VLKLADERRTEGSGTASDGRERRFSSERPISRAGMNIFARSTLSAKSIYRAAGLEEAERRLASFAQKWDPRYSSISALWRRNWLGIIPFFQFPPEIRKIVYTTNAIESLNMSLRKAIKTRGAFPSEEAALKVMYLALRNLAKKWDIVPGWKEALNRFGILCEARFPQQGL
jgi:putative transposase